MAPQEHGDYAAADAYAGEATFPPFDPTYFASQLFWLAITFAVLYVLLSRWVLPRIGGAIEERRDRIADDLDAASQMKAQADEAVKSYERSLADARAKAQSVAAEAKADADKKIAAEMKKVETELEAEQDEAEKRIREMHEKALAELDAIAAGAAAAVAARLAGLEVGEDEAAEAVAKVKE
ncbi:F0F1 ATP synthase subunit B [Marinicauda algicola]|nr:F0F1 ATP synthase subunit B [Marinicauda algicola]